MMEELRPLIANVLGVEAGRITAQSGPGKIDNWDSLAHLSIITAVEERFGVRFTMSEIQTIDSVDALAKVLATRLAKLN